MFQSCPQQQEVFSLMRQNSKMLKVAPTSSGKSIMMILDAHRRFSNQTDQTLLVVAPKLILAQQLSEGFDKYYN